MTCSGTVAPQLRGPRLPLGVEVLHRAVSRPSGHQAGVTRHARRQRARVPDAASANAYFVIDLPGGVATGLTVMLDPGGAKLATQLAGDIPHVSRPHSGELLEEESSRSFPVGVRRRSTNADLSWNWALIMCAS